MVTSSLRTANFELTNLGSYVPQSGYPLWSGTGITGNGTTVTGTFSSSGSVSASLGSTCSSLTGNVEIVAENKQSLEAKITEINTKIAEITSAVKQGFQPFTKGSAFTFDVSISGTGEMKNVDKYADGSATGKRLSLSLGCTGRFDFPHFDILDIPLCTGVTLKAGITFGSGSGSVSVSGSYDESQQSPGSITDGKLEVAVNGASGDVSVETGVEKVCTGIEGSLSIGEIKWIGNILYKNNQLIMEHQSEGAAIFLTARAFVDILGDECSWKILDNYPIASIPNHKYQTVTLWNNN